MRPSHRSLVVATIASLVLSVGSLALLGWVLIDPAHWFPGAYSTNTSAIDDLSVQVSDLSSQLDDLETGSGDQASTSVEDLSARVDDLETGSGDQAAMSLDDAATAITNICDAIRADDVYDLSTALGSFISDVASACP